MKKDADNRYLVVLTKSHYGVFDRITEKTTGIYDTAKEAYELIKEMKEDEKRQDHN